MKNDAITITHGELKKLFSDDERIAVSVYNLAHKHLSFVEKRFDNLEFRTNKDIPYTMSTKRPAYDVNQIIAMLEERLSTGLSSINKTRKYSWRNHKKKIFNRLRKYIADKKDL